MEKKVNKQENTGDGKVKSDNHLMDKFARSGSSAEIENTAKKIIDADPDIDQGKLDGKADQFHKEKKKDAQKQAENDAEFEQPEGV